MESIHDYYFSKIELCYKVDPKMIGQVVVSHILKDLPMSWNCQMLTNLDFKLDQLLPALPSIDAELCRQISVIPACDFNLEQIKDVIAGEI